MIKIVSDTTSSIPISEATQMGIPLLPQIIIFDGKEYRDDYELDTPTFLTLLKAAEKLPKTSAPSPELYEPIFSELLADGHHVIIICPSAEVSGTVRSAFNAAQEYDQSRITVLDTRSIGSGMGRYVMDAHAAAQDGATLEQIETMVADLSRRERIYFLVDTLEYLHKGGRIGGAQALIGGILQVKPILTFRNGRVEPFESQRTKHKALARLKEIVISECPHNDKAWLSIMHCDADLESNELAKYFQESMGLSRVIIRQVPPAIVVHAGPGVIGVSFFVD
ncbi:MAG: DegV family protein [Anaerolineae bacterium]|nr:DegV family protein [Anaerolineae bacterium]